MKVLKAIAALFLLLFVSYVLYLNVRLYYKPTFFAYGNTSVNEDVQKQLKFLKNAMHNGADREMQYVFPEGYVFMNALYGLSQAEMAKGLHDDAYTEAYLESYRCYMNMKSEEGRSIFPEDLLLAYGAYYNGWTAYHMAKLIGAEETGKRDSAIETDFKQQCALISTAMERAQTRYLESYHDHAWPADMMTCIAALAEHDRLYEPLYQGVISKWIAGAKQRLDPLGLLPHKVSAIDGKPLQNARGSSMSLMLCFLKDIDSTFYREQFTLYKKYFLTTRLGLPGVREYPAGTEGEGDSDSGPVIWGVGGSASIVGLRVFAQERDSTTAIGLRNSIEAFGMATKNEGQKKYLFGMLPMADAFIAWANSTEHNELDVLRTAEPWRRNFQIYSGIAIFISGLLIFLLYRRRNN